MRPIVGVDAASQYAGKNCEWVLKNVVGGLKNLGIDDAGSLALAFSQQVLWLYRHWPKISSVPYVNPLVLLFDNRHQYAQQFEQQRGVIDSKLIAPIFWQLGKTMTSFANTLFTAMEPQISIPRIRRFDFQFSDSEFGLQAADLLSHLVYNALKCEMGIKHEGTDLKYELLLHVMPDFHLDPSLKTALQVVEGADGQQGLRCIDAGLLSTYQFMPV